MNIKRAQWICALLAVGLILSPWQALAQEDVLSSEVFLVVMLKALSYDRKIDRLSDGKIVIGVVSIAGDDHAQEFAQKMKDEFVKIQSKIQVKDMPAEVKILDMGNSMNRETFEEQLKQNHISAVAVATQNEQTNKIIFETTRKLGIDSICNSSECVKQGSGLGVVLKDEKPRMMVNLNASKLEGSDYSAKFLALCDVIQ